MSIKHLNPYIHYNGAAAKAIELYEKALGATVERQMRYGDFPGPKPAAGSANLIMHAELHIGGGVVMISDATPERRVGSDGNVQIALHFTEPEGMAKSFDILADGGTVITPIQDMFWGAKFGVLTDVYGVTWLFNCELPKA